MYGIAPTKVIERLRAKVARRKGALAVSINVVTLSGNITRDAEVRQSKSGTAVTSFGIAVNNRRRNALTGEWEDYANFFDVTMFGAYGEKLSTSLVKGTKVALNGSLRYTSWERDGQKRSKVEIIADSVEFMSKPENNQGGALFDDDCPF